MQPWHDRCESSFPVLFIMSPAGVMRANPFFNQITIGSIFSTFSPGLWHGMDGCVIRIACEQYGYSMAEVARHLGLHYSTVSKVLKPD